MGGVDHVACLVGVLYWTGPFAFGIPPVVFNLLCGWVRGAYGHMVIWWGGFN